MVTFTYQRPVPLQLTADEVLREVNKLPHLLLRVGIRGESFPQRALEPFARIEVRGKPAARALLAEIDEDERGLRAYFATDVPLRGTLTVGYGGSEVTAVIPLERTRLRATKLDVTKIEGKFHRVTLRSLGGLRARG